MKEKVYAVLTGDLIESTAIREDYKAVLYLIAADIQKYMAVDFVFDIYRGDSFQGLLNDPSKALLISVLMRAGLRRNTRGTGIDDVWDARIAIGIGKVDQVIKNTAVKLGTLNGDAFVRSGRTLDLMKKEGAALKLKTDHEQLDEEFESSFPLLDIIISRWSTAQAEAVYWYLLDNLTQEEIGKRIGISQRAISKRLETSNVDGLSKILIRFENLIKWKYSI